MDMNRHFEAKLANT